MHYANGREAKNGDKVVWLNQYGGPHVGILYDAQAGNDFCNGKIAPTKPTDLCPNLKEVLHLDDVKAVLGGDLSAVPDLTAPIVKPSDDDLANVPLGEANTEEPEVCDNCQ